MGELRDEDLWRSVEATVRDVLLPAIDDEWARLAGVQLIGLARYACTRPEDATDQRLEEVIETLDRLADNALVRDHWPLAEVSAAAVFHAASNILATAATRDDEPATEVQRQLKALLVRHLDDELAITAAMLPYFRGELPDA